MGLRQPAADRPDFETAAEATSVRCWCGGEELEPLGTDYACCQSCGTVVFRRPISGAEYTAGDGTGFYGDDYWRRYVPRVLGLPGLEQRARSDLPERAVFHLVKILDHLAPGKRILELGCGAGSLTYLLGHAGFDACGLELGPAAVEVARGFGIEVHQGPLETLDDADPWDAIVAVDVLEHLPDPLATVSLCARRLAAGGRLFLQTPCYRQEGPEWRMLLPEEHLHLFTEASVERLLRDAGFGVVEVGGSLFAHDMWITATLGDRLVGRTEPLSGLSPMVVALIDAYAEGARAHGERDAIDADRRRKQQDVDVVQRQLESVRADQAAKQALIERLGAELATTREDQTAKRRLIDRLTSDLESVRADQAAKQRLIEGLGGELASVRADQSAKAAQIGELSAELISVRGDQSAKAALIVGLSAELEEVRSSTTQSLAGLSAELETVRADQTAKAALIDRLSTELETVRADQAAKELVIRQLDEQLQTARAELDEIRGDRVYRFLEAARGRLGGRP